VSAFFAEELVQCATDADCVTGRCDLTPTFTVSIEKGYCGTFQTAFDRWQKVELAQRLADRAAGSAPLAAAVLARVDEELGYTRNPPQPGYAVRAPEKETLVILLSELARSGESAREEALARLGTIRLQEAGALKRLAGLALAEAGSAAGLDDMVEASAGASPRLRLHAARAASGLCDRTAVGVLASLLADPHPLVRAGAAWGLGRCGTDEAGGALERRREELVKKPGQAGDLTSIGAALDCYTSRSCGSRSLGARK
jgi:hypothetical protein